MRIRLALVSLVLAANCAFAQEAVQIPITNPADSLTQAEIAARVLRRQLNATIGKASITKELKARHERFVEAVAIHDQIRVRDATQLEGVDSDQLVSDAAHATAEYLEKTSIPKSAFDADIGELRLLVPRIRNEREFVLALVRLASLELRGGHTDAAYSTLLEATPVMNGFTDETERDHLWSRLLRVAIDLDMRRYSILNEWTLEVAHPELRLSVLRAVLIKRAASKKLNREIRRAMAIRQPKARDAELTRLSRSYLTARRFEVALSAAVVIGDENSQLRDNTLAAVQAAQIASGMAPEKILAPLAITEPVLRDRLTAELGVYSVERSRLFLARKIIKLIDTPAQRAPILAAMAGWYFDRGYRQDWQVAWDSAFDLLKADTGLDGRGGKLASLARQAADFGDAPRALNAQSLTGDAAIADEIHAVLAIASIDREDIGKARELSSNIASEEWRSTVALRFMRYAQRKSLMGLAREFREEITTPRRKLELAILDAKADPKIVFDTAAAEAFLGQISDIVQLDEAIQLLAEFYGEKGDEPGLERLAALTSGDAVAKQTIGLELMAADIAKGNPPPQISGDPKASDTWRATAASALANRGDLVGAAKLARDIGSWRLRVKTMRAIAERNMDADRGSEVARNIADPVSVQPTMASGMMQVFDLSPFAEAPDKTLPDFSATTARDVRDIIPAVTSGRLRVTPLGFSNFNEKFSQIRYLNSVDFAGGDDSLLVVSQKTRFPKFIFLESGVFDLPSIVAELAIVGSADLLIKRGRVYELKAPLLIGANASLVVTSADVSEFRLSTPDAAYLVNSGKLFVVDTLLTSWDAETNASTARTSATWAEFNPFITSWSGSQTYIAGSKIVGLGYANGKSYGLTFSSGPKSALVLTSQSLPPPSGIVTDSSFERMYYGFYSYEAVGVKVVGNEYRDSEIYGIDPHDRSHSLVFAFNATYGTKKRHGIVTSREVDDSFIVGNMSFDNAGTGVMLDRSSRNNVIAYNSAFENGNDGITLFESECNLIAHNDVRNNGRDGVRARNSWDVVVRGNIITSNMNSGINSYADSLDGHAGAETRDFELDPYKNYSDLDLIGNLVEGNDGNAVRLDNVSMLALLANRFVKGEKAIIRGLPTERSEAGILASSASRQVAVRNMCKPARPPGSCRFKSVEATGAIFLEPGPAEQSVCAVRNAQASGGAIQ